METTASQLSIVYFVAKEKTYKLINCLCIFSLQDQLKGPGYKAEEENSFLNFSNHAHAKCFFYSFSLCHTDRHMYVI